ncbi:2-methylcitrate dehydratase [Acidilobus saccharovorans 345-15]|uniref:2-methylcitrate dehydratase n=1 Tax=Acidilobus saccharovorans (strain DSM 16705 / JCM 18335 / VKM B-2471 / 345-15) TaxID=666510 RepID=D9Q292_ACIS3|nr:MmgE/PrpD family protein [Acidilobus saccharovorans]ADL19430.1 2-methylcitrate dehydratase [Acidilobus saccharovorans 345-15]
MKDLASRIAKWAVDLNFNRLPTEVIEEAKKRIADTLGVALGAFNETPPSIARWIAQSSASSRLPATIWGTKFMGPADHVTFANGCAARYFDFNDTYLSREALHPSDNIAPVMAAAEIAEADGRKVIEGIVAAYEVTARLADAYSVRNRGWDHVLYIAIASAVGAGKVLDLDEDKMTQAINLATVNAAALRQTRAGELSMWKGCAAANAARNGLFAALLAWRGMTGPSPIFSGEFGLFKVALGGDTFDIPKMGGEGNESYKLLQTSIKYWPVEYHAMSAVEAALKIRQEAGSIGPDDVESVNVETFTVGYNIIVKDPEKWDPRTRETADHSMPYIIAAALLDGKVWLDTFRPERYLADDVRKVLKVMKVSISPESDKLYPEGIRNSITVKLKDGRTFTGTSIYPPGHYKNPLSKEGVESKFKSLVGSSVPNSNMDVGLRTIWSFERCSNVSLALRLLSRADQM